MTPSPLPGGHPPAPTLEELQSPAGELLERSGAATALADLDVRVVYANLAFLALWGFEHVEDVLGRDATGDFWVEPEKARAVVRALEAQPVWQGELMARRPTGSPFPVRITVQILRDAQGQRSGILGTFVDISAEHALRASLEAERQFSEMLVDGAGVLVAALDEVGRFIRFNRECERVSGWAAEDVLGRFPWDTVLPTNVAPTVRAEAFESVIANAYPGQITSYINEWESRNGERRVIEWTNRVMIDPGGQRRIMVAVGSDVTARHAAQQALARSEAQLRMAQTVARLASWELELSSCRMEWSDAAFDLLEVDKAGFVLSYDAFLAVVHPDDRCLVDQAYRKSPQGDQRKRIEYRLRMPGGRIKWVEVYCENSLGDDGAPLRCRGTIQDVTERHDRDQELLRFRLMVESAPLEVWLTDHDFRIVYANAAACESLRYDPHQLIGMRLADIDADGWASVSTIHDAIEGHRHSANKPEVFRIRHRAADGRVLPKEMYATVREFDGRPYGISFARDISERLRAEKEMAASEAQLRDALDTYPGWVACVDEAMRYVYVSSQFARMVGRPANDLIGRLADEVLGSEGSAQRWTVHKQLLAGAQSAHAERNFVDPQGRERTAWVEYRSSIVSGSDRRRLFYTFAIDITDLRQAERRLAAVTQDVGVGLWELSPRTAAVDFNDELLALAGFVRADIAGDPLNWLAELIEPADRPSRNATVDDVVAGRRLSAQVRMRVRHKRGHAVWIQECLRVVGRDDSGMPTRIIGAAQDISALKAREDQLVSVVAELDQRVAQRTQALEQAKSEAERANAAKSDFLSQMSHELRTPLNAIIGFGQLLEMSTLPPEDLGHVQEVMRAGHHLLTLIDEVLDLATVEAGHLRLRNEPVLLVPLATECIRLVWPEAQAAEVAVTALEMPPGAAVHADASRVRQVLLNLLSNAIKYNRRKGSVEVSVSACDEGQAAGWEVNVRDSGLGLSNEQIGRLFQPFERLGAERS